MSHLAYRPRGATVELEDDYVVIGTGAGGATAAVTLARAGASVTMVEAGPWRDPEDYPHSAYGAMRDMMEDWGSLVTVGRALWPVAQARLVGGTTVVNSAICVRTPGDVFADWERDFGVGGDRMARAVWEAQDRVEADLAVEESRLAIIGKSNLLALEGDRALGYGGHVMRRYVKGCEGSGQCLQGCTRLRKQSTNLNYVPETLRAGGTLLSCAPVERIVFERGRAAGVTGHFLHPTTHRRGARFRVRARKGVFVAASVTHTPLLLARSGVKSRHLGAFFRAHPGSGVFGLYDDEVDSNVGATQGWASTKFRESVGIKLETLSIPMEMGVTRLSGGGRQLMERVRDYRHMAMWIQATRARTVGRIASDPFGRPLVRYTLDRRDMETFRAGMHLVARQHFAAGARAVAPGIHGMPYLLGPDEVDRLLDAPLEPRSYVAVLSHLFGGAIMGTDPSRSVTDGYGAVHGRRGLWVTDASLMPDNIGVNPQHTIMGLAHYVVDHALAQG